ncbi:MAG TPA: hypothetical protein VFG45_03435 [Candidatus Nitrosocosmicus sp.]|nr:hypothetical protein [Candidatus Nitrosocosmicus sp.]
MIAVDNEVSSSSIIQWKTTKYGDDHTTYNEIEKDPYLREHIEPTNGFEITIDGYKYTVKIYDNGNVSVFRKKKQGGYQFNTEAHTRSENEEYGITRNFQGNGYNRIMSPEQKSDVGKENTRILEFKQVNLEEFNPEDGWEIFYQHPIVIIENKAVLILARRESPIRS